MSQAWHNEHFNCHGCDSNLAGQRYILKEEKPYCLKCYEDKFANPCEECKLKIGTGCKDLSYKDRHWHEQCFFCCLCKGSLVDKPFGSKNDQLYCSECYNNTFGSRCDKCTQVFKPGTKKMTYKNQQFHHHCFTCGGCNEPLGSSSFYPRDESIYCVPCYEKLFATRCVKCQGVIAEGGVTYKEQPWHRECFVCSQCSEILSGRRFTSKDEKPFCPNCYGELFAKRCYACTKPICGIGGTKYVSFEDRHWHNDCFVCTKCKGSLVGRGFLTEGELIICPECGRE